jgi:hypothetical protein
MGIEIAKQQNALEKYQARGPHRCYTSKHGQQLLCYKGLNQKQQNRT